MKNTIMDFGGYLEQQLLRNTIDRIQGRLQVIQKAKGASIAQMK
jgi:hypothetical protein